MNCGSKIGKSIIIFIMLVIFFTVLNFQLNVSAPTIKISSEDLTGDVLITTISAGDDLAEDLSNTKISTTDDLAEYVSNTKISTTDDLAEDVSNTKISTIDDLAEDVSNTKISTTDNLAEDVSNTKISTTDDLDQRVSTITISEGDDLDQNVSTSEISAGDGLAGNVSTITTSAGNALAGDVSNTTISENDLAGDVSIITIAAGEDLSEDISTSTIPAVRVFYTADLHDGVRMDFSSVLSSLGQKVILGGIKGSNLVYPVPGLVTIYSNLSNPIKLYTSHSTQLQPEWIEEHYNFYKDDPVIQKVDAFICSFPASMCQLWKPFNKTIIFVPAHRYNLGRCTSEEWDKLDKDLFEMSKSQQPKHVIAATNTYDVEYMNYYTGLSPILLESFGGFYTSKFHYEPTRPEILTFGYINCPSNTISLIPLETLYEGFLLEKIVLHHAMVVVPYSTNAYKQTELYSVSMPLLMPSLLFFKTFPFGHDRTAASRLLCDKLDMVSRPPHSDSQHLHNPNAEVGTEVPGMNQDEVLEAELYWLQWADFFTRPHIIHFDNCTHLHALILDTNFTQVHNRMAREVEKRKEILLKQWKQIINNI